MLDPMGIFPYFFTKKYWIKNLLGKNTVRGWWRADKSDISKWIVMS